MSATTFPKKRQGELADRIIESFSKLNLQKNQITVSFVDPVNITAKIFHGFLEWFFKNGEKSDRDPLLPLSIDEIYNWMDKRYILNGYREDVDKGKIRYLLMDFEEKGFLRIGYSREVPTGYRLNRMVYGPEKKFSNKLVTVA